MLQKRSNNSLNCFRGQILSETKTREINAGIDRKHIGLMTSQWAKINPLSQNEESSTAYSTRVSKVPVLNDKCSFNVELGWIREFALHDTRDKRHYFLMRVCHILANFLS